MSAADDAAQFAPPTSAAVATTITAATPTAALATSAGGPNWWITIVCNVAFNVTFSADGTQTVVDPTDTGVFPAGMYSFALNAQNAAFKVTANATGKMKHWHSSRT